MSSGSTHVIHLEVLEVIEKPICGIKGEVHYHKRINKMTNRCPLISTDRLGRRTYKASILIFGMS